MITTNLQSPILDGGIHTTNFFNGRVLTAEDLRGDQAANRLQHRQLGRAIGSGVVTGLEVSPGAVSGSRPTVKVKPGLALNRRGEALQIADELVEIEVSLVRDTTTATTDAGLFGDCAPSNTGLVATGVGAYILVIGPASGFDGRAPMVGLSDSGIAASCGSDAAVEGVSFRLVPIDLNDTTIVTGAVGTWLRQKIGQPAPADLSQIRNVLAHLCFGTKAAVGRSADPFLPLTADTATAIDVMYASGAIRVCEVPLALIYWGSGGIGFVDNWAVRRIIRSFPFERHYPPLRGYGEERLYQFLDHFAELKSMMSGSVQNLRIDQCFRFLPPLFFFSDRGDATSTGYDFEAFFTPVLVGARKGSVLGTDKLTLLLRDSFLHDAIDLTAKPCFQLCTNRENQAAIESGTSTVHYAILVSRTMHGPVARDEMMATLHETWASYGTLAGILVGNEETGQGTLLAGSQIYRDPGVWISLFSAVRDVMDVANLQQGLAVGYRLDCGDALTSFKDLYKVQATLATLMARIAEENKSDDLGGLAERLRGYLEDELPDGSPGLKKAISSSGSLTMALAAQGVINELVGSFLDQ